LLAAFANRKKELSLDMVQEIVGEIDTSNRYWHDEVPENHVLANNNFLQEIVNRLCRIEEEFFENNINQSAKTEIFERLSVSENLLNKYVTNSKIEIDSAKGEISVLRKGMSALVEEINTLRNIVKGLCSDTQLKPHVTQESGLSRMKEQRKQGLLRRFFQNAQRIND
jgi:hypothetical protein